MKRNTLLMMMAFFFSLLSATYAQSATKAARHMIKENTGRCFFYESVTKTNLGWLSKEELKEVRHKGIKPYMGKQKQVNLRQVYVPRDWCGRKNS